MLDTSAHLLLQAVAPGFVDAAIVQLVNSFGVLLVSGRTRRMPRPEQQLGLAGSVCGRPGRHSLWPSRPAQFVAVPTGTLSAQLH